MAFKVISRPDPVPATGESAPVTATEAPEVKAGFRIVSRPQPPAPPKPGLMERAGAFISSLALDPAPLPEGVVPPIGAGPGPARHEEGKISAPAFTGAGAVEPGHDLTKSVAKAIPRGALDMAGLALESSAEDRRVLQNRIGTAYAGITRAREMPEEQFNAFVDGLMTLPSPLSRNQKETIQRYARDVRAGKIEPGDVPDFRQDYSGDWQRRAQKSMREFGEEYFPIPPEDEERLAVQVGRGIGSVGAFAAPRLLPGGQGFVPILSVKIGQGEALVRAAEEGASDEEKAMAGLLGTAPGLTEIVPIENLFRAVPISPGIKGALIGTARKAVEQGLVEGTQEGVQQFLQNAIAQYAYASEAGLFDDVPEGARVGALVGALFGGGRGAGAATRASLRRDREEPAPPSPTEAETAATPEPSDPAPAPEASPPATPTPQPRPAEAPSFTQAFEEDALDRAVPPEEGQTFRVVDRPEDGATPEAIAPAEVLAEAPEQAGTRAAPVRIETPADVTVAAERTAEPTEAQKEAGNYQKRHVKWQGLDIAIETEQGQARTGTDPDGNSWRVSMPVPYGYLKRTKGADGEQVDVYVGPDPKAPQVFVVDQVDADSKLFDEHKAMLGFPDEATARATYEAAFSDGRGPERIGAIRAMPVEEFKAWLRDGDTTKPVGEAAQPLTAAEAKEFYQRTGYAQINRFLREGVFPNVQGADRAKAEATIAALKESATPAAADLTVYRGMPANRVGPDKGFVSVTTDPKIAHDHARKAAGGAVVRMTVPAGTPIIEMPSGEGEALLLPGTELKEVARRQQEMPAYVGRRQVTVVDAVLGSGAATAARQPPETDAANAVRAAAEEAGIVLDEDGEKAAAALIRDGMEPRDAVFEAAERAAIELEAEEADTARTQGPKEEWHVPFDTAEEAGARSEAARPRQAPAQDDAEAETGTPARGEQPRRDQPARGEEEGVAPTTERTDAGDQTVIPGAERISDKALAERRMEAPKRAAREQRPADEGLFDTGARGQGDLVDMARQPKADDDTPRFSSARRSAANDNEIQTADQELRALLLTMATEMIDGAPTTKAFNEEIAAATADNAVWARGWSTLRDENRSEIQNENREFVAEVRKLPSGKWGLNVLGTDIAERFDTYPDAVAWVLGDDSGAVTGSVPVFSRTATPDVSVSTPWTGAFLERAEQLYPRLRSEMDRIGLKDIGLKLADTIEAFVNGEPLTVQGMYWRHTITLALDARDDPARTLRHESLHALRGADVFTDAEWATLSKDAQKWRADYDIDRNYAGFPEDVKIEEAIAHAWSDWDTGAANIRSNPVKRLFARIRNILNAMRNAFRGLGFQTAEDVFERVESGEVGSRRRENRDTGERFAASDVPQIDWTGGGGSKVVKIGNTEITYGVSRDGATADVILVKTPKAKRGEGSARAAMQAFLREADRNGTTVFLTPEPMDKGVSKSRLEQFYKSLGFASNKGRNKDFRAMSAMVRQPRDTERFSIGERRPRTESLDGFMEQAVPEIDSYARTTVSDFVRYMAPADRAALNDALASAPDDAARYRALADAMSLTLRGTPSPENLSRAVKDAYRRLSREVTRLAEERQIEAEEGLLAGMTPEPREPGKKRAVRPSETAAARSLLRRAPKLPDPGDYGFMSRLLLHPYQIATKDPQFANVFHWGMEFGRLRNEAQVLLGQVVEPYMALSEAERSNVNKVLEIGRLDGRDFSTSETISVTNENYPHAMLPRGESLTLTDKERQGYLAARGMLDRAILMFKQQALKEAGLGRPGDPRTGQGIRQLAQDKNEDLTDRERADLERAADMVDEIENARRAGYVPFSRYGTYSITVTDSLGGVAWFEKIEEGLLARERAAKRRAELEKQFPKKQGFTVQPTRYNAKLDISGLGDIDFAVLDEMAKRGGADAETVDAYHQAVQAQWTKEGFRSHFINSKNTPGYEQDFTRSLSDYIVGITGYLARRNAMGPMEDSIAAISPAKANLRQYAKDYKNYIFNPVEEWGQWRQLMFFGYLSGNPSSAALNLTQVPIFTYPYLSMVSSPVRAAAALANAARITAGMIDQRILRGADKRSAEFINFDVERAPADIRDDLRALLNEGTLVPMVTLENMGVAQGKRKFMRGIGKRARNLMDIAGTLFTAAERYNRIVTAIAALRIAKSDKAMMKAEKAFAASNIWQDLAPAGGGTHTSADLARFIIWETHFLQGKGNRPKAMRGIGAPIMQFKSFMMNALQTQYRMATMYGPQGKRAFAMNMLMLFAASGLFGLPGSDDAREWAEFFNRFLRNVDLDIEKELQAAAVDLLGEEQGPWIGEAIRRGFLRQSGVDMSRRVGMGEILPFSPPSPAYNPMAQLEQTLGPLGIPGSVVATGLRAADHFTNGDWATGLAEISRFALSAGGANAAKAYAMDKEGLRSRNRVLVMHPDEIEQSDIALRIAGFQSTRIARRMETDWMQTRAEGAVRELNSLFYKRLARAMAAEDEPEVSRIWDEIKAWNAKQPDYMSITINKQSLRRAVQQETLGKGKVRDRYAPVKSRGERGTIREIMPGEKSIEKNDVLGAIENNDPARIAAALDAAPGLDVVAVLQEANRPALARIVKKSGDMRPEVAAVLRAELAA